MITLSLLDEAHACKRGAVADSCLGVYISVVLQDLFWFYSDRSCHRVAWTKNTRAFQQQMFRVPPFLFVP